MAGFGGAITALEQNLGRDTPKGVRVSAKGRFQQAQRGPDCKPAVRPREQGFSQSQCPQSLTTAFG